VPAFWVKVGTNDLYCVDVLLNPTHWSLVYSAHCVETSWFTGQEG